MGTGRGRCEERVNDLLGQIAALTKRVRRLEGLRLCGLQSLAWEPFMLLVNDDRGTESSITWQAGMTVEDLAAELDRRFTR